MLGIKEIGGLRKADVGWSLCRMAVVVRYHLQRDIVVLGGCYHTRYRNVGSGTALTGILGSSSSCMLGKVKMRCL